jgi:quinol monooxygenase YgiN
MPASPWRTFGTPDPNSDVIALLSYLPLKSYRRVLPFFYTAQVVNQLACAEGLLGYSVLSHLLSKRFWTLSAWKSEAALRTFINHPPHKRIMTALTPHMGDTKCVLSVQHPVSRNQRSKTPPARVRLDGRNPPVCYLRVLPQLGQSSALPAVRLAL